MHQSDSLAARAAPLDRLIEEERLTEIPGVGEAITDIITKLQRAGMQRIVETYHRNNDIWTMSWAAALHRSIEWTSLAGLSRTATGMAHSSGVGGRSQMSHAYLVWIAQTI